MVKLCKLPRLVIGLIIGLSLIPLQPADAAPPHQDSTATDHLYVIPTRRLDSPDGWITNTDVAQLDPTTQDWQFYFDGSDVGWHQPINALALLPDGSLLLSPRRWVRLPQVGYVRGQDVIRFVPTQLGPDTTGHFEWYLDGSDVGLNRQSEHLTVRGSAGHGIELIDSSPNSLTNIVLRRLFLENNALGGILAEGLIADSPMSYTIENNTIIGGQYGLQINMLEQQAITSLVRNNLFIGQTEIPIKIDSVHDGGVIYRYNLFNQCARAVNGICPTDWLDGTLSPVSQTEQNLLNLDPEFGNVDANDYSLLPTSSLIDAGDPNTIIEAGVDGGVPEQADIGAFETELTLTIPEIAFQEVNGQVVIEAENTTWHRRSGQPDWVEQTGLNGYVGESYLTALPTIPPSGTDTVTWRVWLQPNEARALNITADLADSGTAIAQATASVNVPQADIKPVVVVAGFLGTWPPSNTTGTLDPLTHVYDNLLAALQQTGYILGEPGTDATLIPFAYDWRQHLGDTGRNELAADVQAIVNTHSADRHSYVDYSQVNIIAHSAGGLVSRAFIQDATANNERLVNKFITLGTPHRGLPKAYRAWYGGQWNTFFGAQAEAEGILTGLYLCDSRGADLFGLDSPHHVVIDQNRFWNYLRNHIPSSQDFLPVADVMPEYLLENVAPFTNNYPFGLPPNQFLEDMQTPGGNYDVDKLTVGTLSTKSYYSSDFGIEAQYRVDPPLGGTPANPQNTHWGFGEVQPPVISAPNSGDGFIPNYSADITNIALLSGVPNITQTRSLDPPPPLGSGRPIDHVSLVFAHRNVRQLITDLTDTAIENDISFWHAGPPQKYDLEIGARVLFTTCSPVRTIITDPQDRRAGLDPITGQIINEIPGAIVAKDGDEPHIIIVPRIEGEYHVQMQGTDDGIYRLGVARLFNDDNPISASVFTGTATANYMRQLSFELAAFQETDGLLVVEAENFTWNVGKEAQGWMEQDTLTGYSQRGYTTSEEDIGQFFSQTQLTMSPELQYTLQFDTPGSYSLWLRGYAPNAAGDSVYIGFDNQPITVVTGFVPRQWSWSGLNNQGNFVTIEITKPGIHTLNIWQREDGFRLDQIVLTQDSAYNPTNDTLNESSQIVID